MVITVNGESQVIEADKLTLADLLARHNVRSPESVSVQRNSEFVDSSEYNTTFLHDNDEVDFLYFLGGGAESETSSRPATGADRR